jgi:hypothetical protein
MYCVFCVFVIRPREIIILPLHAMALHRINLIINQYQSIWQSVATADRISGIVFRVV